MFKIIKSKISKIYNSQKLYFFIKLLINFLLVLGLYPFFMWSIDLISRGVNGEVDGGVVIGILLLLFIIGVWLCFNGVVEWLFVGASKIEDNMVELPKNIGKKNAIVQYDLSQYIAPCEAGMLLYGRSELSNLLCLIYKWINEKIVRLHSENGNKYLEKVQDLNEDAPYYEKFLFACIFYSNKGSILFNKKLLKQHMSQFSEMLVTECMKKGYIDNNISGVNRLFISKDDLCNDHPIVKKNFSVGCLLFTILFLGLPLLMSFSSDLGVFIGIVLFLLIFGSFKFNETYYINLSDKGKEVLSKIYGYKYYLEHCEEEQINSDLEDGEVYSKHLPYAIALKLNRKMIDELS